MAAAWLLDDELRLGESAVLLQVRSEGAIVPQVFHLEIRNALLVAARRGRIDHRAAEERIVAINDLPLETDTDPELGPAFALALEHSLTFYDAIYLELAIRRGATIATLDRQLARAAAAEGVEVIG